MYAIGSVGTGHAKSAFVIARHTKGPTKALEPGDACSRVGSASSRSDDANAP